MATEVDFFVTSTSNFYDTDVQDLQSVLASLNGETDSTAVDFGSFLLDEKAINSLSQNNNFNLFTPDTSPAVCFLYMFAFSYPHFQNSEAYLPSDQSSPPISPMSDLDLFGNGYSQQTNVSDSSDDDFNSSPFSYEVLITPMHNSHSASFQQIGEDMSSSSSSPVVNNNDFNWVPSSNFLNNDINTTSTFLFDPSSISTLTENSPFRTSCLPPLPCLSNDIPVTNANNNNDTHSKRSTKDSSSNAGKSTTKKRKKNQSDGSVAVPDLKNFVELSEDELLKLDSQQMELYLKNLNEYRTVGPEEDKELKKLRRLIKNREYAQSSRNKKKQYIEEMEEKVAVCAIFH